MYGAIVATDWHVGFSLMSKISMRTCSLSNRPKWLPCTKGIFERMLRYNFRVTNTGASASGSSILRDALSLGHTAYVYLHMLCSTLDSCRLKWLIEVTGILARENSDLSPFITS